MLSGLDVAYMTYYLAKKNIAFWIKALASQYGKAQLGSLQSCFELSLAMSKVGGEWCYLRSSLVGDNI